MTPNEEILNFYKEPGIITALKDHQHLVKDTADDIPALVRQIQGLVIHVFWFERMGVQIPEQRKGEVELRYTAKQLDRILELNSGPLKVARPGVERLVGNCRDFSTIMAALLRQKGVPARARCGFGCYFLPDHYEDHWVCEVWDAAAGRWVLVDSQLDEFQCKEMKITFSPLDVPRDEFLTAGVAWQMCRNGEADPDSFGIFDMHGMWFIRGNLVRDFLSLNKIELLPWDVFGLIGKKDEELSEEDMALLDTLADLTIKGDQAFTKIRSLFEEKKELDPSAFLAEQEE